MKKRNLRLAKLIVPVVLPTLLLGGCPQPADNAVAAGPALAVKGSQLAINQAAKTLTVNFNKSVDLKDKTKIDVFKAGTKTPADKIESIALKQGDATKIIITLKDPILKADEFHVVVNKDAITDLSGNKLSRNLKTEPVSISKDTPVLGSGRRALTIRTGSKTLEVEFNQPLKAVAAKAANLITVNKTPSGGTKGAVPSNKITSIGLKTSDATRVQIVLEDAMVRNEKYQVDFLANAVTSMNDRKNTDTLSTETVILFIVDNTAPILKSGGNALLLVSTPVYNFGLGLQVSFSEYIARFDASKIEVHQNGVKLNARTLKAVYFSELNRLVLVLKKASSIHARYQVKFKANAVFDVADNENTETLSTETDTLDFMVKGMAVNAAAKTLTLDFSKDITNSGALNTYEVYQNFASSVEPASAAVSADNRKSVILTLGGTVRAADRFYVRVISGRVTATCGRKNTNVNLTTGVVSEKAAADTTAPKLKSSGNISVNYRIPNLILLLTFNEALSITRLSSRLVVSRDGKALPDTDIQSFFKSSSEILSVVLKPAASLNGVYRVQMLPGLVKDLAGNFNGKETSETADAAHFQPNGMVAP